MEDNKITITKDNFDAYNKLFNIETSSIDELKKYHKSAKRIFNVVFTIGVLISILISLKIVNINMVSEEISLLRCIGGIATIPLGVVFSSLVALSVSKNIEIKKLKKKNPSLKTDVSEELLEKKLIKYKEKSKIQAKKKAKIEKQKFFADGKPDFTRMSTREKLDYLEKEKKYLKNKQYNNEKSNKVKVKKIN